jgi:uncharacterized membrane protein
MLAKLAWRGVIPMTWRFRRQLTRFIRYSIWLSPVVAMIVGMATVRGLHWIDSTLGLAATLEPEGARTVLGALAASMFTFVVFVSSALLVVFQLASAQLTPRIVAILFRDPVVKISLTIFVFSFTITLGTILRITSTVPLLTTQIATYSCVASLAIFLVLIDHVCRAMRPNNAMAAVARRGRTVIEDVYPRPINDGSVEPERPLQSLKAAPDVIEVCPAGGVLLAFDFERLVAYATRMNCMLELVPEIGDFVVPGEPLFRIWGSKHAGVSEVLNQAVDLGKERSLERDPMYAFRILVDVAAKALSPSINDPTSAVAAIDQIHHLLRAVGARRLDEGELYDADGKLRLIYRTPDWEDFVQMAATEIRHFGGGSIQIARRLRAMLENLIQVLPDTRQEALRHELTLLQNTTSRLFADPDDRALAEVGDSQGVGGSAAAREHRAQ